jgi:putative tryptophan/tyrosine transport system substrate-binding protein
MPLEFIRSPPQTPLAPVPDCRPRYSGATACLEKVDSAVCRDNFVWRWPCGGRQNRHSLGRTTLWIAAAWLVAAPLVSQAQEKPLQIGVLALGPRYEPIWRCGQTDHRPGSEEPRHETMPFYVRGLLDELQKLKYVEDRPENAGKSGRRFVLSLRMGTVRQVRDFAREFVAQGVDVIVAVATATVRVAQEETRGHPIPILMTGVSQPVGEGFVQSLARPGGFITGVSHQLTQGSGKRVELFKEMQPKLRHLVTIRRPGYTVSEESMVEIQAAANRLKVDLLDWTVTSREELRAVLQHLKPDTADGIMITPDSLIISNIDLVLETSLAQRVPTFGLQEYMADWGAIAAYGPSAFQAGARVARYVDKISRGAKPGDLPVEPIDPTFVINLKAAECFGISPPLELLRQADRVIR